MVRIFRIADRDFRALEFHANPYQRGPMIPRITLGLIIVVFIAYVVGAKWPGLAQKIPGIG